MTDDMTALRGLMGKSPYADFLREMISLAAQRMMELEVALTGAAHGQKSPEGVVHRNGYQGRDWETLPGRWNCASPSFARAAFAFFLEPSGWSSRRRPPSSRRPSSRESRPAR